MPPKLRRPAAAKGAGKAAPVRGARVVRGLRRPAGVAVEERVQDTEAQFLGGEFVEASQAPVRQLSAGILLVVEGEYWGGQCTVCGKIQGMKIRGPADIEVTLGAEGTTNEELLKWVSGNPGQPLRVHLCGERCEAKVEANDLIHAKRVRVKKKEGEEGWSENLKGTVDELAVLRRDVQGDRPAPEEKDRPKEKKKTKKKKKKERKERSSTSGSGEKAKSKGQKRRVVSQKDLVVVYGTTGLDPDPRIRKRLLKRVKRKLKKKKGSSADSTGSSLEGSSQESSLDSSESGQVFEETQKVRSIARKAPGLLTYGMVKEMQRQLLTSAGTLWSTERDAVPPIALQYYRGQLSNRLSGGAAREALTLSWALDLALQGKMAQTADCLSQRLKSLELVAGGATWSVAQRVEVVPMERARLSSRAEAQAAAKEDKEELKTRQMSKGKDKGKGDFSPGLWRAGSKGDQKGKERGKGKKGGEKEENKRNS
jgi:hypothetical protein